MLPWFITTTVSASAIASGCVCVTWTKVMPSSFCRRLQLAAHAQPQELVERRQRLVEEEHAGIGDQRAGERDALLLAAGKLRRHAVGEGVMWTQLQHLVDAAAQRSSLPSPRIFRLKATLSRTLRCGNSA